MALRQSILKKAFEGRLIIKPIKQLICLIQQIAGTDI